MSNNNHPPWNNPKTPKLCPTGGHWSSFGYSWTHGHPGYICARGEHFLNETGARDTEKEAIANMHHKLYIDSSEKYRKMAGKTSKQQEALAEFLAPMKKTAIDNTWHELNDLQRKRKNGHIGPRPEKVEDVPSLYERYKLKYPYVSKDKGDGKKGTASKDPTPDESMAFAGPSTGPTPEFYRERAEALARAEADKQGQLGGNNRGGKQTDEYVAAVKRIMLLKSTQHYEILGLTGDKTSIRKADIVKAYHEQNLLVDPDINGQKDAKAAFYRVLNAKNGLLPKHKA